MENKVYKHIGVYYIIKEGMEGCSYCSYWYETLPEAYEELEKYDDAYIYQVVATETYDYETSHILSRTFDYTLLDF